MLYFGYPLKETEGKHTTVFNAQVIKFLVICQNDFFSITKYEPRLVFMKQRSITREGIFATS